VIVGFAYECTYQDYKFIIRTMNTKHEWHLAFLHTRLQSVFLRVAQAMLINLSLNAAWRPYKVNDSLYVHLHLNKKKSGPTEGFSQPAQTWPCCFNPLGVSTHLPLSQPFCSNRIDLARCWKWHAVYLYRSMSNSSWL